MKKNKIISSAIAIFIIILVVSFFGLRQTHTGLNTTTGVPVQKIKTVDTTKPVDSQPQTNKAVLEINGVKYEDEIVKGTSVYDFMSKLRSDGKINFTEKTYTGMGKFIASINDIAGNQNKNWIYYVNGKEAGIGISNYKINPGDVVSWKYEKSNY